MIVVDASAALSALLNSGAARSLLAGKHLHVPHLVDSEIADGLRRHVARRDLSTEDGWASLDAWRRLGVTRHPVVGLLDRLWQLRDDVSAYDATYVALTETLGCSLVTADPRLSRAAGVQCTITVVPR